MKYGLYSDQSTSTFSLANEDHSFPNAVRFTLNQDPRVTFCGYSIPHPSDNRVNTTVQTTGGLYELVNRIPIFEAGNPAREVLKDACQDMMLICQHVRSTFDRTVNDFRINNNEKDVDIK